MEYNDIRIILCEIKRRIQRYLDSSKSYKGIYISDINYEYIELKNKTDKVCVKILFEELFGMYNLMNDNELEDYKYILNRVEERRISDTFFDLSYNRYYYDKGDRIETWADKLTSYENRLILGFYNKRGRKAEFLIEESRNIPLYENGLAKKVDLLLKFNIGKAIIKISKPTQMFKLIYRVWINADFDGWWDYYETIQIEDVSREKLNKYLQQSIFICNIYNIIMDKSILKFGVETTLKHYNNYYEYDNSSFNLSFPESKYEQPLAFYNQAFSGTDETAFLYYYKVLEFFFYITKNNREMEYESEKKSLKRLVIELNFNNEVKEIIRKYFSRALLELDDVNNIDCTNITIEKFAEKLYKYRNSVVHGKYDETNLLAHGKDEKSLFSHVPMNLLNKNVDIKLKGWNCIAQKLAFLSIRYFCFDNINFINSL